MKQKVETVLVPLRSIAPDPHQPRKNFNPERLAELIASIKKYGIINPLVVEKLPTGKYLLVDGERRFRAATELKLGDVPVVVREQQNETERLIQKFHIQEQHEGWTATEKASAVARLAKSLNMGVRQLAKTLSLPDRTIGDYVAFSDLLENKEFEKNEIPVHFASHIVALRGFVKRTYMNKLRKDFDEEKQSSLEKTLISRIKRGDIRKTSDITKVRDAIKQDPKSVDRLMNESRLTVDKLFLDVDADAARTYRNIVQFSNNLAGFLNKSGSPRVVKLFDGDDKSTLSRAHRRLGQLISVI